MYALNGSKVVDIDWSTCSAFFFVRFSTVYLFFFLLVSFLFFFVVFQTHLHTLGIVLIWVIYSVGDYYSSANAVFDFCQVWGGEGRFSPQINRYFAIFGENRKELFDVQRANKIGQVANTTIPLLNLLNGFVCTYGTSIWAYHYWHQLRNILFHTKCRWFFFWFQMQFKRQIFPGSAINELLKWN